VRLVLSQNKGDCIALAVRKSDPFYTLQEARRLLRNMWIGNPLGVIGNKNGVIGNRNGVIGNECG
jgi:hypothetical protein